MSERIVKIAIALSLFCLLASAVFYVSSVSDDPVGEPSAKSTLAEKVKQPKQRGRGSESFELPAREDVASSEVSSVDETFSGSETYEEEEEVPTLADDEGLVAGGVFLKNKDALFEDVQLYLIQVKAFDVPASADEADEEEVAVEEAEEPVVEVFTSGEIALAEGLAAEPEELDEVIAEVSDESEEIGTAEDAEFDSEEQYLDPIYVDEAGGFERIVAPGEYKLIARAPGHLPVAVEGIIVNPREEVRGIVLELDEGLKVSGYVRTEDAAPQEEIEVTLEGEGYRQTRYTDGEGSFEFTDLPKGAFKVSAFDPTAGKAEAFARAGETTVSLRLGFHELTGMVVDELGMPVAEVEVVGRSSYQMPPSVDRDPYGTIDGISDPPPQELRANEEQYAVTDEAGRFTMKMAGDGKVALSVQSYDGQSAFVKDVDASSRGVQLRLSRGAELKLMVTEIPAGVRDVFVELEPIANEEEDELPFYSQSQASNGGELTFYVPSGVKWMLRHDGQARVEPMGALPSNVTMGPVRKPLRRRHNAPIAIIKQQDVIDQSGW